MRVAQGVASSSERYRVHDCYRVHRNSQLLHVTVASRERPNFARISRKTPPPKFRKTLRDTLAYQEGNSYSYFLGSCRGAPAVRGGGGKPIL